MKSPSNSIHGSSTKLSRINIEKKAFEINRKHSVDPQVHQILLFGREGFPVGSAERTKKIAIGDPPDRVLST